MSEPTPSMPLRLEDLTPDAQVTGLIGREALRIVSAQMMGEGGIAPPPAPPQPTRKTTFVASLKLDPMRASLQMGDFLDEVMSHIRALPCADVNLSVEVHVKVSEGIDDATARIVLENCRSLKVDNPQIY